MQKILRNIRGKKRILRKIYITEKFVQNLF